MDGSASNSMEFSEKPTMEELRKLQSKFNSDRKWEKYHTPRNLVLALMGEVGELAEIFQWKGDANCDVDTWSAEEKQHLGEELSDVLLYLIRLSDVCKVDLPAAALRKINLNAVKYPVEKCMGSCKKYTELNK